MWGAMLTCQNRESDCPRGAKCCAAVVVVVVVAVVVVDFFQGLG